LPPLALLQTALPLVQFLPRSQSPAGTMAEFPVFKHCPSCGFAVGDQVRCPLCDTSLVEVNLRRALLWALVLEEYFVVALAMLRHGWSY